MWTLSLNDHALYRQNLCAWPFKMTTGKLEIGCLIVRVRALRQSLSGLQNEGTLLEVISGGTAVIYRVGSEGERGGLMSGGSKEDGYYRSMIERTGYPRSVRPHVAGS